MRTKIGDVFSVKINENEKKYFQLITFDLTQLNSDVIRAFKKVYKLGEEPNLSDIIKEEVEFYAHCIAKAGLKMNLWEKVGTIEEIGDLGQILFRDTNDYGLWVNNEPIKVSENWFIWRVNDNGFTRVGKLKEENRNAEIGIVVNPYDIVERMKTGRYSFFYPEFE